MLKGAQPGKATRKWARGWKRGGEGGATRVKRKGELRDDARGMRGGGQISTVYFGVRVQAYSAHVREVRF